MNIKRPDYKNSIMNVSKTFLHHYNVDTNDDIIETLNKELQKNYNHVIYVLLDGMGSNIIKEHLHESDALYKYMRKEITSVFPPTTVAATNAVLSGKPPIETGYLGWVQYFKNEDTDLTVFLNKDFYTGKEQPVLLREKYLKYENILSKIHNANPHINTNIIFPGFIDQSNNNSFKDQIDNVLLITHNTDHSFNYVYWTQPDLIEHKVGIHHPETKEMLQGLNKDFEELIENIDDDTLVVCIADHGLIDVEEINLFSYETLKSMLQRNPSIEPRTCNFFVKPEYLLEFKTEFNRLFKDYFLLMTKEDLLMSELFGTGTKHELIDQFLGDYIAVAIDNKMFSIKDEKQYKAHHAGLTEGEMMVPLIIYSKK